MKKIFNNNKNDYTLIKEIESKKTSFSQKQKYQLLIDSIYSERVDLLKYLLAQNFFVYRIDDEYSVYEACIFRQNYQAFRLLNDLIPVSTFKKDTSLNIAVMLNLPIDTIKWLESCVYDINVIDYRNMSCVDWAIQNRNNDTLSFLLSNNAKIRYDLNGNTQHCFSLAVSDNNFEAIKLLIKYGVNPNEMDDLPLDLAIYYGFYELAEFLLQNGVDINKQDEYGKTSFHYVAIRNNKPEIFFLKKHGADDCIPDDNGITAAQIISDKGLQKELYEEWYGDE